MMRKGFFALLAMTAMSVAANPALADYLDIFLSVGDQRSNPSDPLVDPNGEVTWGSDWMEITLPYELDPLLGPGESIFLGLENIFVEDNWKEVTLEYEAFPGIVPTGITGTRAGYPAAWPGVTVWDDLSHEYFGPPNHRNLVTGIIDPQPSWEWIELTNNDAVARGVRITKYTSKCVPEPGTLALLAFGGMMMMRRSRR